jgi:phage baseplate assembly protein W
MALDVKKINPLDRQPRKAVGLDLPFSGQAVFNSTFQTKDALKVNLINYFLTNKGERPLNPTFGSGIRELLFENITENALEEIKAVVKNDLSTFFPRVIPTKLELFSDPDTHIVSLYMKYAIRDANIQDEVLINIE